MVFVLIICSYMNMIFVDKTAVNNDGCELTMSVMTLTYTCTILKYWTYHTYTQYFNTAHNIYIGNTSYTCTILKYCTHTISSRTQTLQSTKYDSCIHFGGLFVSYCCCGPGMYIQQLLYVRLNRHHIWYFLKDVSTTCISGCI